MPLLIAFAFISGVVTILSPCILPVLPLLLTGAVGIPNSKAKPLGIISGFVLSFTTFTLLLATIVKALRFDPNIVRNFAVVVIFLFGLSLLLPELQKKAEVFFSYLAGRVNINAERRNHAAFIEGVFTGISLGILWSPCVGPILASVIALAISGTVNFQSFLITLAYSVGTAIPMFAIMLGGNKLLTKTPWLTKNTTAIQKAFGVIMLVMAIVIASGYDRKFQTYILTTFPKYGAGLTKFEQNPAVIGLLNAFNQKNGSRGVDLSNVAITKESNLDNEALPKYALAPELRPSGQWFNSQPLQLQDLRGKVVLLDIWTYSCINCQRTLPYVREWWDKYKDKGLVIIGVHSPEFEFEKDPKNVAQAVKDFKLTYPIFQDNDFITWRAYSNQYWPAKYLIDKDGYIRYFHFGEGNYDETEKAIQTLLKEAGNTNIDATVTTETYNIRAKTPETYVGFYRANALVSPEPVKKDQFASYTIPPTLIPDKFAFDEDWLVSGEYALPKPGATLSLNYDAENVYLVLKPHSATNPVKVKVFVDGKTQFFGKDNKDGTVTIDKAALYNLVTAPGGGRHRLKLEFVDGDTEVYAFTFG